MAFVMRSSARFRPISLAKSSRDRPCFRVSWVSFAGTFVRRTEPAYPDLTG